MMITCPCCGQSVASGHAPIEGLSSAPLSRTDAKIVDILVKAYPRPVVSTSLIDMVYADDPDGGPEQAESAIQSRISVIRKKLTAFGWTIPPQRGGRSNYGAYRLSPVEKEAT